MQERAQYGLSANDVVVLKRLAKITMGGSSTERPPPERTHTRDFHFIKVLLTSTVAASSWDSGNHRKTPEEFTAVVWKPDPDGFEHSLTYDSAETIDGYSYWDTEIAIASGKGRFAYLDASGELIIADCEEITL